MKSMLTFAACLSLFLNPLALADDSPDDKKKSVTAEKTDTKKPEGEVDEDQADEPQPPSYELAEDASIEQIEEFLAELAKYRPDDRSAFRTHLMKSRVATSKANEQALKVLEEAGETDSERYFEFKRPTISRKLSGLRNPERAPAVMDEVAEFLGGLGDKLTPADGRMAVMSGYYLANASGIEDESKESFFGRLQTILAAGGEETEEDARKLDGILRRMHLIGQEFKLSGTTYDGESFDIADLRGKVVLVDFWATWCGPCIAEHPNIEENYEKYRELGFEVVGVSVDRDRKALESFVEDHESKWIILHDEGGRNEASIYYGVIGIPSMFLLDQNGKVVSTRARGKQLGAELAKLLGEPEVSDEAVEETDSVGASSESDAL